MKHTIPLPSGQIAYQQYGSGSKDIVFFHGLMGSSWMSNEWIETIEQHDVRCIAPERLGYGDSSPITMDSVSDWFSIIKTVVEALDIRNAVAVGGSAGAVYAYASAYGAPDAFREAWILDGVPTVYLDRVMRHYPPEARTAYAKFLTDPPAQTQEYYAAGLDDFLASLPADADPYMRNTMSEARKNNCFGPAQESRLQITPWGFDPAEIKQPIKVWHAERDTLVPYGVAPEMVEMLPTATLTIAPSELFTENDSDMDVHIRSISEGFFHFLRTV